MARNLSRRHFIGALAAAGAGSVAFQHRLAGLQTAPAQRITDVHHHFYPPDFIQAWLKAPPKGEPPMPPPVQMWTPARSLEQMDKTGVTRAMLSTSIRVNTLGQSQAESRDIVRRYNEFGIGLTQKHPGRFGLFGILPMPDVEGSLLEIRHVLDTLKADGISLFTNYGARWLGNQEFRPVLEELNRRGTVVYTHPVTPGCCGNLLPINDAVIEYPHDTTRAVLDLLISGTFARYRNIRWIFSHGGGTVPMLAGRIKSLAPANIKNLAEVAPQGVDAELKRLYFEIANAGWPATMAALLAYMPVSQVLFGTDFPFLTLGENLESLRANKLTPEQLRQIEGGNAEALLRRAS
jgi:predicted TIM-barrel fold metal-dependent hydrolase